MNTQSGTFPSKDGLRLYWQGWLPPPTHRGTILIIHGAGEHCGRYGNLIEYFASRGYCLYGFDFRGHGQSPGKRCHVLSWQEYREDLHSFLAWVMAQELHEPLFLFGHSMGAQVMLDYLTNDSASKIENNKQDEFCKRICGVIASGAAIAEPPVNPIMRMLGRLLSVVLPSFTISSGLNTDHISRDHSVVCAYRDDPLVSSEITARWATEFLKAMQRVQSNAHRQPMPIFMYHGGEDQIIPPEASRQYFSHMKLPDKQLKIYAGGFHEPHNDLQKLEVFEDIENWMDKQE